MARVIKIKKCTKCGNEYPANLDYFHRDNTKPDKLHSWCKNCKQESDRKNHKENYNNNREAKIKKSIMREKRIKEMLDIKLTTIHDHMKRIKSRPNLCPICHERRKLDLCSIGHTYSKKVEDWIYLCRSCHTVLDRTMSEKSGGTLAGALP